MIIIILIIVVIACGQYLNLLKCTQSLWITLFALGISQQYTPIAADNDAIPLLWRRTVPSSPLSLKKLLPEPSIDTALPLG